MSRQSTVTQNGMCESQPGTSVSVSCFDGKAVLRAARHYQALTNEWGGFGRMKSLDYNDREFPSSLEAFTFALEKGYLRAWNKREYPNFAFRAAMDTINRGEYKGNRKLTKYLISRIKQKKMSADILYNIDWLGRRPGLFNFNSQL